MSLRTVDSTRKCQRLIRISYSTLPNSPLPSLEGPSLNFSLSTPARFAPGKRLAHCPWDLVLPFSLHQVSWSAQSWPQHSDHLEHVNLQTCPKVQFPPESLTPERSEAKTLGLDCLDFVIVSGCAQLCLPLPPSAGIEGVCHHARFHSALLIRPSGGRREFI